LVTIRNELRVAFETVAQAGLLGQTIQFLFGNVAVRWVSEIMRQSGSLSYVWIKTSDCRNFDWLDLGQSLSHTPRQLSHLQRVREAIVKDVAPIGGYNLRDFS
jgi:hypothetical protein